MSRRPSRAWKAAVGFAWMLVAACGTTPAGTPTTGAFQVASLGDSYAAGQGAPDEPRTCWKPFTTPAWQDKRCNRSLNAPTAQAVASLEQKGHSVGLASFACSGATIEEGMIGPHQGPEPQPGDLPLDPQVEQLASFASSNPVDAVTISIGGNDIGFQNIVVGCMLGDCTKFEWLVELKLEQLGARLDTLAANLAAITSIPSDRILLLEYPDPTQDSNGDPCDGRPVGDALAGIKKKQAEWAADIVLQSLNHEICKAAKRHGWSYVTGIQSQLHQHGYCASPNWINTVNQSIDRQQHYRGAMHPNETGYAKIAERVEDVLESMIGGATPGVPALCPAPPPL